MQSKKATKKLAECPRRGRKIVENPQIESYCTECVEWLAEEIVRQGLDDGRKEKAHVFDEISMDRILGGPSCGYATSLDPHADLSETERLEIAFENVIDAVIEKAGGDNLTLEQQRDIYRIMKGL